VSAQQRDSSLSLFNGEGQSGPRTEVATRRRRPMEGTRRKRRKEMKERDEGI